MCTRPATRDLHSGAGAPVFPVHRRSGAGPGAQDSQTPGSSSVRFYKIPSIPVLDPVQSYNLKKSRSNPGALSKSRFSTRFSNTYEHFFICIIIRDIINYLKSIDFYHLYSQITTHITKTGSKTSAKISIRCWCRCSLSTFEKPGSGIGPVCQLLRKTVPNPVQPNISNYHPVPVRSGVEKAGAGAARCQISAPVQTSGIYACM